LENDIQTRIHLRIAVGLFHCGTLAWFIPRCFCKGWVWGSFANIKFNQNPVVLLYLFLLKKGTNIDVLKLKVEQTWSCKKEKKEMNSSNG
jgi:hypothetical protein